MPDSPSPRSTGGETALVVIDVQHSYFEHPALAAHQAELTAAVVELLRAAHEAGRPRRPERHVERGFARRSEALLEFPLVAKAARTTEHGPVAQLVSAPPCHGGGRGFKSRQGRSDRPITGIRKRSPVTHGPGDEGRRAL